MPSIPSIQVEIDKLDAILTDFSGAEEEFHLLEASRDALLWAVGTYTQSPSARILED
jgi:hypothetical protein